MEGQAYNDNRHLLFGVYPPHLQIRRKSKWNRVRSSSKEHWNRENVHKYRFSIPAKPVNKRNKPTVRHSGLPRAPLALAVPSNGPGLVLHSVLRAQVFRSLQPDEHAHQDQREGQRAAREKEKGARVKGGQGAPEGDRQEKERTVKSNQGTT